MANKGKGSGVGILLIIVLAAFALRKKNNEIPPNNGAPPDGNQGEVTPVVSIKLPGVIGSPAEIGGTVSPGVGVQLEAQIRNSSTRNGGFVALPVTVRFHIYEGSIWPGHGTLLRTLNVTRNLLANATTIVSSPAFASVVGSIDRRDVGVEVVYQGDVIGSNEWDDVYYVKQPVTAPAIQVLSIAWM